MHTADEHVISMANVLISIGQCNSVISEFFPYMGLSLLGGGACSLGNRFLLSVRPWSIDRDGKCDCTLYLVVRLYSLYSWVESG